MRITAVVTEEERLTREQILVPFLPLVIALSARRFSPRPISPSASSTSYPSNRTASCGARNETTSERVSGLYRTSLGSSLHSQPSLLAPPSPVLPVVASKDAPVLVELRLIHLLNPYPYRWQRADTLSSIKGVLYQLSDSRVERLSRIIKACYCRIVREELSRRFLTLFLNRHVSGRGRMRRWVK